MSIDMYLGDSDELKSGDLSIKSRSNHYNNLHVVQFSYSSHFLSGLLTTLQKNYSQNFNTTY